MGNYEKCITHAEIDKYSKSKKGHTHSKIDEIPGNVNLICDT